MGKDKKQAKQTATIKTVTKPDTKQEAKFLSFKLLEQARAEFALKQIQAAIDRPEQGGYKHSQVKSFSRRFPSMVQTNGFGQAVAFFYAKRNDYPAYGVIYQLVEDWLCQSEKVYAEFANAMSPKLLNAITQSDQRTYRQATAETQALMIWVKKFAEGLILKDEEAD